MHMHTHMYAYLTKNKKTVIFTNNINCLNLASFTVCFQKKIWKDWRL